MRTIHNNSELRSIFTPERRASTLETPSAWCNDMADSEFEEFRRVFDKLPQHIKAPTPFYS
ncbi:jg26602, partial [Pararge aegeria aegeria]